jgi:hypothetical protein
MLSRTDPGPRGGRRQSTAAAAEGDRDDDPDHDADARAVASANIGVMLPISNGVSAAYPATIAIEAKAPIRKPSIAPTRSGLRDP